MLILPPNSSLSDVLVEHLAKVPPYRSFSFAVAWARLGGVERIAQALDEFHGQSIGIVGLNQKGSSYEALFALLERLDELWVFYKHPRQTFHPKIYLFSSEVEENQDSVVLIGSSNLTVGGLETNFEAVWCHELGTNESDVSSIDQIINYFEALKGSGFCHRVESEDFLVTLLQEGTLDSEGNLRRRARRSTQRDVQRTGDSLLPTAPPPPILGVERITVPLPLIEDTSRLDNGVAEIDVEEVQPGSDTLFYVRTLTPNDVRKALRVRPGTWEPDLGLEARDEHPAFWGWPDRYEAVHAERTEWRTTARYQSRMMPAGVLGELCLWFRPERAGHPAEHRFRPDSRIRETVVPPDFNTNSLMVVQRLPEGLEADFRVDFILPRDPEYQDYQNYLTIRKPAHRRGYGAISDLED